MTQIGQRFSLSNERADGVFCSEDGLFVGNVALLNYVSGSGQWQPRPADDLNHDLSKRYGLPIAFDRRIDALSGIARALNRRDVIHAQIATLHLRIPDPPSLAKSKPTMNELMDLAYRLRASGLLKADWDPAKHPRWPAGSPHGVGGEFAPSGATADTSAAADSSAQVIPVQAGSITAPWDFALLRTSPFPSEIGPGVPAFPTINPREGLRNPYPDRPECEQEWAEAIQYCGKLELQGLLGKGRGMGRTFRQCVLGQVSDACGGGSTA